MSCSQVDNVTFLMHTFMISCSSYMLYEATYTKYAVKVFSDLSEFINFLVIIS